MNAVVTLAIGDHGKALLDLTGPAMRRYARRIGVGFEVIAEHKLTGPAEGRYPFVADKFQLIDHLGKYDRVCFLDADVLVTPDCPDIFGEVPEDSLGWSIHPEALQQTMVVDMLRKLGYNGAIDPVLDASFVNTGVMVIPRCYREVFNMARLLYTQANIRWFNDEPAIHFAVRAMGTRVVCLSDKHNHIFDEYTEVDALPPNNIIQRLRTANKKRGVYPDAWKKAHTVHYVRIAEDSNLKINKILEGLKYFYGREL